jgi:hypothetical protein
MPWYESQSETYQRKILESERAQERHLEINAENSLAGEYSQYVGSGYSSPTPERRANVGLRIAIAIISAAAFAVIFIKQFTEISQMSTSSILRDQPGWSSTMNHEWTMLVVYLFIPGIVLLISIPMVVSGIAKNRRVGP